MFSANAATVKALGPVASKLLNTFPGSRVFAFYGRMGAGKTTFIQAICHSLGITDIVTSPTFALINEYNPASGEPVYHFDFYRIKNPEEVFDMGYEDYLFGDSYCLVEWPEKIEHLLPPGYVRVHIDVEENENRKITATF